MKRVEQASLQESFMEAYDAHAASILRHITFRVGDRVTAQDITSEVFFKSWEYARNGNHVKDFKSLFYAIAHNLLVDYYRKKVHAPLALDNAQEIYSEETETIVQGADKKTERIALSEALERLPEDHRRIVTYRYFDELSIAEIQKITGKSAAHIYVIIHRARVLLKKYLPYE